VTAEKLSERSEREKKGCKKWQG